MQLGKTQTKVSTDWAEGVSIIVPTFRRPAGLKTAIESLASQSAGQRPIELIIADNDPDGSAQSYIEAISQNFPYPVRYFHAPNPGVANARNLALTMARGRYLAFLDDDQFANAGWLTELLSAMQTHNAGLAFCPTYAQSRVEHPFKAQCLDFFTRDIQKEDTGLVDSFFGCGNSLMDLNKCRLPSPPFSPLANETGGEDDLLFAELQAQGINIVWTSQTSAGENVEDWRMTHSYIRTRSFAYGQGPSRICAAPNKLDITGLIRWTCIGAAQFAVFSPLAYGCKIFNHKNYIPFMRKASEGAGKVLWYEKFRPKIYGASALKKQLEREENTAVTTKAVPEIRETAPAVTLPDLKAA